MLGNEDERVYHFMNGLKPAYQVQVATQEFATYHEVLDKVKRLESKLSEFGQ